MLWSSFRQSTPCQPEHLTVAQFGSEGAANDKPVAGGETPTQCPNYHFPGLRHRTYGPWALLVAGTVFLLLHIPQMRDAVATAKAQRVQEIAQENKLYCEKWGMRARTHEHIICTMDLNEIREKVAKRIAEDSAF